MVFSSLTFLFFFIPCLIILYFIIRNRTYRNAVLLIFSLIFYAWGEPKYIILMIFTIIISYIFGLLINKYKKKSLFIISIILILGNLFVFKYTNFIFDNINGLFKSNIVVKNIILPIGISFYTFQILSYIIDLYYGKIKVQKNFFKLALYVMLFPQLIAGPIVRYETIEKELSNRKESINGFVIGLRRFIIGLSKKVIISNNVAMIADFVFNNMNDGIELGSIMFWLGAIAYAIQIYYDFSGYSDMAIGLGKIFGFNFLENFDYPYISTSITEFWRRWHISLGSWFRDYLYIPLGGNRVSKARWVLNIFIVWFATGLWHGASWNFIVWGLYFGLILLLEKLVLKKILDKTPIFMKWLYSIVLIIIGWVIFRVDTLTDAGYFIANMFNFSNTNILQIIQKGNVFVPCIYLIIGIIFSFPIFKKIENLLNKNNFTNLIYNCICLGLLLVCIIFLVSSNYNPFIYFRF